MLHGDEYAGEHGKLIGAVVAFILSLIVSMLIKWLDTTSKGKFGTFGISGREPQWRFRERQSANIKEAKRLKKQRDPDQAIKVLDNVLKEDPNCPEAQFAKAQIFLSEYKDVTTAGRYLRQVIKQTAGASRLNRQAEVLYERVSPFGIEDDPYDPYEIT